MDPALKSRPGVALYNIDDLQAIAQEGLAARQQAVRACVPLIEQQVRHYLRWQRTQLDMEAAVCGSLTASG